MPRACSQRSRTTRLRERIPAPGSAPDTTSASVISVAVPVMALVVETLRIAPAWSRGANLDTVPDPEKPMSDELDVAGKVLQELGPHAADFAARITGSATNGLGEALADRARLRRFRTQAEAPAVLPGQL